MIIHFRPACYVVGLIADAIAVAVEAIVVRPDVSQKAGKCLAIVLPAQGCSGVPMVSRIGQGVVGVVEGIKVDVVAVRGKDDDAIAIAGDCVSRDGVAVAGGIKIDAVAATGGGIS